MRRFYLGLFALLLAGCSWPQLSRPVFPPEEKSAFRALGGPVGSDVVVMEAAVLETNVGDKYVNEELWNTAIEQSLPPETRKMLEDNGMRAGLIAGQPPDFLQIITSERTNPNPRRLTRRLGDSSVLSLGPQRPQCQFQLITDGKPETIALPQAQCLLQIQPVQSAERKLQLQFTPQVQHGEHSPWSQLGSAVGLTRTPVETYSALRWEMTIDLNEYLVIGARLDKPNSLGCRMFVTDDGDRPVQRLLAIRAGQLPPARPSEGGSSSATTPLAYQASRGITP
jgi:hypothetical protein